MHFHRSHLLATLTYLLCAAAPMPAHAQWSGSASAVSDYRFRGLDLADGRPTVQAGAAYDAAGGWYAGGFAARTRIGGRTGAQLQAFGGYAGRLANGVSWETGISASRITQAGFGNYQELYAGIARHGVDSGVSARLYWSPHYLAGGSSTLYAQLEGGTSVGAGIDAFVHAGAWHTLSGPGLPQRGDLRTGLSGRWGVVSLQLAYERAFSRTLHRYDWSSGYGRYPAAKHAVSASVTYTF
jgi:uncharacterized protein (TIGR02001 family)